MFPGPNAYTYSESDEDDAKICQICLHEDNIHRHRGRQLVFHDIVQHLQKFHKFSESELPAFLKEKEKCKSPEPFVSVSTIASELLQGGESKKTKCMESKSPEMETQLQKFPSKFALRPQPPNPFHIRVPLPHN